MDIGFIASVKRQVGRMCRRPVYVITIVILPLLCAWFFLSLLGSGLPLRTPAAVVDLDHSSLSRQVTRALSSNEMIDVSHKLESRRQAMVMMRSGRIFGYFVIPDNFEKETLDGNAPTLEYYTNMTYFVPGTLAFRGFKTVSVVTSGGVATAKLSALGLTSRQIAALVQPVQISVHGIGNPWINYNYYLTPSFVYALTALLIMIMTAFSITLEIKHGTSPRWLATAKGHIGVALMGKLLPQTVMFTLVLLAIEALMVDYCHFPMNGSLGWMLVALMLFVLATQALATFITCILPNPRVSMSVISLLGVLTFSFAGFSFPVEQMYGAIAAFSYCVPVRYLFLIHVNTALNGFETYYVRYCYAALLAFLYLPWLSAWKLRKACLNPVYVP